MSMAQSGPIPGFTPDQEKLFSGLLAEFTSNNAAIKQEAVKKILALSPANKALFGSYKEKRMARLQNNIALAAQYGAAGDAHKASADEQRARADAHRAKVDAARIEVAKNQQKHKDLLVQYGEAKKQEKRADANIAGHQKAIQHIVKGLVARPKS